ncbi:hypothetical protein NA57DRAFT_55449 [Rhizodiscina lignyota]|uniref:DUF218 domain-containing protein n=1 Tax=Rhizodiscina lignyota TaxID=1504668 RepID=A0A9P4IHU4_9PEZI|nr:hypothetical protein NA57DRAFT_55449 [Rhizodiscina lignyota]
MAPRRPLTILCCHAVYTGTANDDPFDEKNWVLKSFQKADASKGKAGEHTTFIQHLQLAVRCWQQCSNGVLIFSGTATEKSKWEGTEARGYLNVLDHIVLDIKNKGRILLEEHATDSYQNILFSILLYNKKYREWPDSVTVVTHAFKRHRIIDLHARAIKWPPALIDFQGIDPPFSEEERAAVEKAEARCCEDWEKDMYGVRPPLRQKRIERGLDEAATMQLHDDGDVRGLLGWDGGCQPAELYPDELPWEKL